MMTVESVDTGVRQVHHGARQGGRPGPRRRSARQDHHEQPEKKGRRFRHRSEFTEPELAEEKKRDDRSPGDRATGDESLASAHRHQVHSDLLNDVAVFQSGNGRAGTKTKTRRSHGFSLITSHFSLLFRTCQPKLFCTTFHRVEDDPNVLLQRHS
jgi:hypothetical protein